jgi:outer membrane protein OmpA-like peptidoglycan-associated protein
MRRLLVFPAAALLLCLSGCRSCTGQNAPEPVTATPPPASPERKAHFVEGVAAATVALSLVHTGDREQARPLLLKASDELEVAKEFGPQSAAVSNNLGVVRSYAGEHTEAVEELKLAAKNKDDLFHDLYAKNLGDAYARAGEWGPAADQYTEVALEHPADPVIAVSLVRSLARAGRWNDLAAELGAPEHPAEQRSTVALTVLNEPELRHLHEDALVAYATAAAERLDSEPTKRIRLEIQKIPDDYSAARGALLGAVDGNAATLPDWWSAAGRRRKEAYINFVAGVGMRAELDARPEEAGRLYQHGHEVAPEFALGAVPLIEAKIGAPDAAEAVDRLVAQVDADAQSGAAPAVAYRYHRAAALAYADASRWSAKLRERGARYHVEKALAIAARDTSIEVSAGFRSLLDEAPAEVETGIVKSGENADGIPPSLHPFKLATLDPPLFEWNKAKLLAQGRVSLDTLAKEMDRERTLIVCVEGHTDSTGLAEYNLRLGEQRAEAVRAYLAGEGIDPDRVESISKGESAPAAGNETEEGRRKNRRAAIVAGPCR